MSVAAEHGQPWPEHRDGWTVDDLLAAPENKHQRIELVHGKLVVTPAPGRPHQRASYRLHRLLETAADTAGVPAEVLEAVNVVLPAGLVIPDIVVVPTKISEQDSLTLDAAALLAVVEIVSPNSRRLDRAIKPRIYAEAGTPVYWRVELDGSSPHLAVYQLRDGRYVELVNAKGGQLTEIPVPFPVTVDPAELTEV